MIGNDFKTAAQRPHGPSMFAPLYHLQTERDVIDNLPAVIDFLHTKFDALGYERARANMDLLIETKGWDLKRKDGFTPSILHEITQAMYTLGLVDTGFLRAGDPVTEAVLCLNFNHDLCEEYGEKKCGSGAGLSYADMKRRYVRWHASEIAQRLNKPVDRQLMRDSVLSWRMAKTYGKQSLYPDGQAYYNQMARHVATALAKPKDRIQNNATLMGGAAQETLQRNLHETREIFGGFIDGCGKRHAEEYRPIFFFDRMLIAHQVREIEHYLGILLDPAFHPGPGHDQGVRDSFTLPLGFNPVYQIDTRAITHAHRYNYPLESWHPALEHTPPAV